VPGPPDIREATVDEVLQWARTLDLKAMTPQQAAQVLAVTAELLREVRRTTHRFPLRLALAVAVSAVDEWRHKLETSGEHRR